ncbi:hypothetical protein V8E55_007076 [Tylopilus felleus]
MLPFALKVIWFCLSSTGIIVCWIVLGLFSRAIGSYWWPMLYSIFATLLQGIFCLGMIYDMNPYQMPKAFCIVQTFVIYYAAWSITGVCAAFTFATSSSVLWISTTKGPAASALAWKNKYYFPIFVFPLACLSISVPVLLSANAIQPTDDLHCDASHPEWGRFLGYAGFSMILTIPCFFLSAAAARRVYQLQNDIQRCRFSLQPSTSQIHSRIRMSNGRDVPFEVAKSPTSPSNTMPASVDPEALQSIGTTVTTDIRGPPYEFPDTPASATFGVLLASKKRVEAWEDIDEYDEVHHRRRMDGVMLTAVTRIVPPTRPNLAPAIWRLIAFQMAFFVVQCLAALSTVIDVARHRPTPTPFGSQHVALILVGWGPAFFFGHLPAVRRQLMFWKK